MIIPVMAISNLVLTQQIYFEETNDKHAHNNDRVPLKRRLESTFRIVLTSILLCTTAYSRIQQNR